MASSGNYSVTNLQVEIGDVIEIYYENYINLVSDKKDVDHKSRIAVPHGFEILKAEFVVRKQEHEVTRRINIIQPGQLSLSSEAFVRFDKAMDAFKASAQDDKEKLSAFASLEAAAAAVSFWQVMDASNRGIVDVYAHAEGHEYSSDDGILKADLRIEMWRRTTSEDVTNLIAQLMQSAITGQADVITEAVNSTLEKSKKVNEPPKPKTKVDGKDVVTKED